MNASQTKILPKKYDDVIQIRPLFVKIFNGIEETLRHIKSNKLALIV